jgi:dolichol-phosphate mannosyltransferase
MSKTVIMIPTYNEADNLMAITQALFDLNLVDLHILIVDDASPDGTGQIADQLAETYAGRFNVIHRPGKLGVGSAYIQGFTWAMEHAADYIVQMDADFSHSPEIVPRFLELIPDYDVVVGSRYVKGSRLDDRWGFGRKFLSWWANSVWVRFFLGLKTRDATAGFKCWRASALRRMHLEHIRSNGYIFQVEMCYISEKMGLRIKEIPIFFEERRVGTSKMSMRIKIEAALRVFEIRRRYRSINKEV